MKNYLPLHSFSSGGSITNNPLNPTVVIIKENRNGTIMANNTRFRRSLMSGMSAALVTALGIVAVMLVLSSSSRSIAIPTTNSTSAGTTEESIQSPHRHPFVRPPLVESSSSDSSWGRRSLFSRSPSSNPPTKPEPRFLIFGTSTTYGVGLDKPLEQAYPYQLSSTVHNAATQSGGFTMAAACTQSIVGNDAIYNVIVVEFQTWDPALTLLVQRLRQRFPKAMMILLRLWHPSQLLYQQANGTVLDFQTYRKVNGNRAMDDPELYLNILAKKHRWSFAEMHDEAMVLQQASRHGASYFAMNLPDKDVFEYPKTMMDQLSIFQEDSDNLNAQGHAVVASSLKSVVRGGTLYPATKEGTTVGSWGEGDECRLWYENGLYHAEQDSQRLRRVEFDRTSRSGGGTGDWFVSANHKHALEVDVRGGSILTIHSPFPTERMLYLTYLTAPVHSGSVATGGVDDMVSSTGNTDDGMEDDYAQLRVRINQKQAILIEAWHTAGTPNQELARTTAVGMLPPGTSTVQLDPVLHHDHQRTRPFRLLGWSLLPETVEGRLSLEYSLEESRVPVEDYWNWFSK